MPFHHLAHLDSFAEGVAVGKTITKGQLLGYCGKTGTGSPHAHYEIHRNRPANWNQYVWGLSKQQVQERYIDPNVYVTKLLPMKWNSYGYRWLSPISSGKRLGFHPGVDLNWGSGFDDYRLPLYATTSGVITYMGNNPKDGSWGNHLFWQENIMSNLEGKIVQDAEETGAFALIKDGKKRIISTERAGLAALTLLAQGINKTDWDILPNGDKF